MAMSWLGGLILKSKAWLDRLSAASGQRSPLYMSTCVTSTPSDAQPGQGRKAAKSHDTYEGKTPALGDAQGRPVAGGTPADTLKGKRDRAILSVLLFFMPCAGRRLTHLLVKDFNHERRGVPHLRVHGKGGKLRYIPTHTSCAPGE